MDIDHTKFVDITYEIDESTAIFKVDDTPPQGSTTRFVGNDGMPSDHYLFLTGKAAQVLRKEISLSEAMPAR